MYWFKFEDLDEDHAPPKAAQSSFGNARVVVMTCRDDNQRAGRTFEGEAHHLASTLTSEHEQSCPIHQRNRRTQSGLLIAADRTAADLTDVRAAYLVTFATLGYRWAVTDRLDELRRAIAMGDLRHAHSDFEVLCLNDAEGIEPFRVYEVTQPIAAILVVGSHTGVVLPCHSSPPVIRGSLARRASRTSIRTEFRHSRAFPWPKQYVTPGGSVDITWDDGSIFHYDRCERSDHHSRHAVPRTYLYETLFPDIAGTSVPSSAQRTRSLRD